LVLKTEAAALCAFIKGRVAKCEALQVFIDAAEAGTSDILVASTSAVCGVTPLQIILIPMPTTRSSRNQAVFVEGDGYRTVATCALDLLGFDDNDDWSADESWERLDNTNIDKMLDFSIRPATAVKYGPIWNKWLEFVCLHEVEVMPPEVRVLEIFIANTADFSGSARVARTAAAAVAHFCALAGLDSPFGFYADG
jgi:hypothetical protein